MLYGQYDYTAKFHILLSIYQGDGTISISCGAVEMGQGMKIRISSNLFISTINLHTLIRKFWQATGNYQGAPVYLRIYTKISVVITGIFDARYTISIQCLFGSCQGSISYSSVVIRSTSLFFSGKKIQFPLFTIPSLCIFPQAQTPLLLIFSFSCLSPLGHAASQ